MKIQHHEPYALLRAQAYPPIGEQLDAIHKLAVALRDQGMRMPAEVTDWIDKRQAVKDLYAKLPEAHPPDSALERLSPVRLSPMQPA